MKRVGSSRNKSGFTIVELLIVVVVIAILAAITLVSFNGITNRANDAAVKSDLSTLKKRIDLFVVDNQRRPNSLEIPPAVAGFKAAKQAYAVRPVTDHNLIYCAGNSTTDPTTYAIIAYSKSGKKFIVTHASSVADFVNAWTDQTVACQGALSDYASNLRGYAGEDSTTGPWRTWAGGN